MLDREVRRHASRVATALVAATLSSCGGRVGSESVDRTKPPPSPSPSPSPSSSPSPSPSPSPGLSGKVFELTATGAVAISGAQIFIHTTSPVVTATTDSLGLWSRSDIPPGPYYVQVNKPGYQMPCAAMGNLPTGGGLNVNTELYSDAAITAGTASPPANASPVILGKVSSSTGQPVANAVVTVVDSEDSPVAWTKTNTVGQYFVCRVPSNYHLSAIDGTSQSTYDIGTASDRTVNLVISP